MDKKIAQLKKDVEKLLPEAPDVVNTDADFVILHQDAFAGDLQPEEFILLGKFIKYIGLSGKNINIIGKNDDTINRGN